MRFDKEEMGRLCVSPLMSHRLGKIYGCSLRPRLHNVGMNRARHKTMLYWLFWFKETGNYNMQVQSEWDSLWACIRLGFVNVHALFAKLSS